MFGGPPFALIGRVPPTLVNLMPKFGAYLTSRLALVVAISGLVIGALAYGAGMFPLLGTIPNLDIIGILTFSFLPLSPCVFFAQ